MCRTGNGVDLCTALKGEGRVLEPLGGRRTVVWSEELSFDAGVLKILKKSPWPQDFRTPWPQSYFSYSPSVLHVLHVLWSFRQRSVNPRWTLTYPGIALSIYDQLHRFTLVPLLQRNPEDS